MHLDENQELVWRPAWNSPALTITLRMLYPQCQGAKPDGVPYNHMDRVTAAMEDFSIFAGWNVDVGMFCQQSPNVSCGSPAASCSSCSCPSSSFGLNSSHLLNNMGELFTDPSDQGMAPPWTHMTLFPQRIESPFLQGSPSILQRPYVHQQQCYPPVRPLQILPSNALASRPGSSASTSTLNQNKRKARHGACKSCRDRKKKVSVYIIIAYSHRPNYPTLAISAVVN